MGNKWSIAERPGICERCRQLETIAQKIFQSPKVWTNGFIRLVSLEGTWYYHRGTGIFVPVEQGYLEHAFGTDGKPEKGVIRLKTGNLDWDYLDDLEAQQILPNLAGLNLPKVSGKHNLSEICQTATIFLKGGKVYDGKCRGIRFLQNNEKATVLQICHVENAYSGRVHKDQKSDSWRYDIYLWARIGVVPAVLCNIKECWNTIQFLRDNFNDIDFTDYVLQGEKTESGTVPESAGAVSEAASADKNMAGAAEAKLRDGAALKPEEKAQPESAEAAVPGPAAEPESREELEPAMAEAEVREETESREELKSAETRPAVEPESREEPKSAVPQLSAEAKAREESKAAEPGPAMGPESREEPKSAALQSFAEVEAREEPKAAESESAVESESREEPESAVPQSFAEAKAREESKAVEAEISMGTESQKEEPGAAMPKSQGEAAGQAQRKGFGEDKAVSESIVESREVAGLKSEKQKEPGIPVSPEIAAEPGIAENPEAAAEPGIAENPEAAAEPGIAENPEAAAESGILEEPAEAPRTDRKKPAATEEEKGVNPAEPECSEEQSVPGREETTEGQDGQESERQTEQSGRVEEMGIVRGQDEIQQLLDCDKNRCRLEPYDKDILYDIIRGHWELVQEGEKYCDDSGQELIPRDPRLDIREGVIGIDFGTKSTVVVRQDATNRIVPLRIGTGNLSSEVKEEDFENPSIIEFINVEKFLEDYQKEAGRPHTSCNDVLVSYDAYEDFRNCKPEDFCAYFRELKQWANREKGNVVVKDKQKAEYTLGAKIEEAACVVNPIELYAYYIGLAINNMRNGIYLKYLMTFPVGYAKETRDFIAESFYEGIKKSLPSSVINDRECMEQFKVELGISEPAAYAVTALEQSNLEPEDETQRRMYGIFDFGGGTTDFDFGICRGATEEEYEEEAYDYVLECFGADSDVTLGGENILELIAYQVYQRNLDMLREKKITLTLPLGEKGFAGSETLLINSQIARRNMAILKEELRPLWHQEQGWRKKYQLEGDSQNEVDKEGMVVSLYNMDGEPVPQCVLEFSSQELMEILKNRIQKGIDSFFQCMIKVFQNREDVTAEDDIIYIFLAGNASKSVFVRELFQRKIEEYYSKSKKTSEGMENVSFVLIDPLTGENERGGGYVPNAKTGVAYGLLKSRDGSSIKIIKNHETDALQQSRFHYYLGRDHRHCFDCRFSPAEIAYKKWVPFQKASKSVVRVYYTNNPMADSKMEQLPVADVPYKEISIDVTEGASLFIRTVEPDVVEYAVAKDAEDISENEIRKCLFD